MGQIRLFHDVGSNVRFSRKRTWRGADSVHRIESERIDDGEIFRARVYALA
jgi:hypothetical protein